MPLKKRNVLKITTLMLSMGVSLSTLAHDMGLQLYSVRNQMQEDAPSTLAKVSEWGIVNLEAGGNLHGYSLHEFKALLDLNGFKVVSADSSFEEIRDNPMAAVYKAHFYGAKLATIYWAPHEGKFTLEDAKHTVEVLNKGGAILAKHGITLQYHPHGYEFDKWQDGTLLDYIIQNTTHASFEMDVFWVKQAAQDPLALLNKYPNKFTSMHLKDRAVGSPYSQDGKADKDTMVVLGQGDVGIEEIVKKGKEYGVKYFFIEDESDRVMKQVPKSIEYLESINF
ncbi:sugar phosphate isomerase [Agaribacter marinus]|uniref:Sugar phosphate isomerase n=1 Tax=Agaribacter marinus TaxID=1431249 RepID=A0AA37WGS7_9ALTE|nr:sugar phosphate isomerase [Agaribacter marinus]